MHWYFVAVEDSTRRLRSAKRHASKKSNALETSCKEADLDVDVSQEGLYRNALWDSHYDITPDISRDIFQPDIPYFEDLLYLVAQPSLCWGFVALS